MESTEKCDAVISQFNGKFIKTPPGVPGNTNIYQILAYCNYTRAEIMWVSDISMFINLANQATGKSHLEEEMT